MDTTYLSGNINELTAEFRARVEDLLENTDGVKDMTTESLARWVSEEFSKMLVEREEEAWELYDDDESEADDPDGFSRDYLED